MCIGIIHNLHNGYYATYAKGMRRWGLHFSGFHIMQSLERDLQSRVQELSDTAITNILIVSPDILGECTSPVKCAAATTTATFEPGAVFCCQVRVGKAMLKPSHFVDQRQRASRGTAATTTKGTYISQCVDGVYVGNMRNELVQSIIVSCSACSYCGLSHHRNQS